MTKPFYKCDPFNFVPLSRTPWAGKQISDLKKNYFSKETNRIPNLIGESWEVSTDGQFPSKIKNEKNELVGLSDLLKLNPKFILGQESYGKYGSHFPLLLKWLEANDTLSVQLHPSNSNARLKQNECGKPEAWLVLNAEEGSFVYLGFKEGLSQEEIIENLRNDEAEKCLHKYTPNKFDFISVPPGCVHAVGPGVLLAEPQYVLPEKIGKTWRISDWKRLYSEDGKLSPLGKPRELHVEDSFSSINWSLPRGVNLEQLLIKKMHSQDEFLGDKNNPFALKIYCGSAKGKEEYTHAQLLPYTFSIFTVWAGQATLSSGSDVLSLSGGESGFICAEAKNVKVTLEENGCIAFFSLNDQFCF